MSEQSLKNVFLFHNIYNLFGVETDTQIISRMTIISLCSTIIVIMQGFILPAPYGRYLKSTRFTLNAKFSWMIQESPSFFVPLFLISKSPALQMSNPANLIGITLFMAHYFQRTFVYPLRISTQARPVPIWSVFLAFTICFWNGLYQGHHLINVSQISGSNFVWPAGALIFMVAMFLNIEHDAILINLSESRKADDGTTNTNNAEGNLNTRSYKIPRGGLFNYISGANYFFEILEWIGFALITRQLPQILFACFSIQFLGQRARHHHAFYKSIFGETYPPERKAIIPFIL